MATNNGQELGEVTEKAAELLGGHGGHGGGHGGRHGGGAGKGHGGRGGGSATRKGRDVMAKKKSTGRGAKGKHSAKPYGGKGTI